MGSNGFGPWVKSQIWPTFNHYKSGWKNVIDPTGAWGTGGKGTIFGILGDTKQETKRKNEANDLANKPLEVPSVTAESVNTDDPERLKRVGRASLITTSSRGVLNTGETSSRKLFGV